MNIAQGRVKYTQGNGKYKQVSANFGAAVENYERAVENYESAVENFESLIGNCETSVPLSVVSKVGNFRTKKKGAYLRLWYNIPRRLDQKRPALVQLKLLCVAISVPHAK